MGKDEEKAGADPDLRDLRPDPPGICRRNSRKKCKEEAVRRSAMKGAAVSVQEKTREDIHIRQVGQDSEVKRCSPTCEGVPR